MNKLDRDAYMRTKQLLYKEGHCAGYRRAQEDHRGEGLVHNITPYVHERCELFQMAFSAGYSEYCDEVSEAKNA